MKNIRPITLVIGFVVCGVLARSVPAHAQGGSIGGTVKDASGAVLPGVTVEATSPALIEKVRTVTTDGSGEYKLVDLRPGTYRVTFTLPGFGTIIRSEVELTTGFTATVNADLKVGAIEETLTVSGAAPVVDVQSTNKQSVLSDEVIRALPTAGSSMQMYASLTLGAVGVTKDQDVGGTRGESGGQGNFAVHGAMSGDSRGMLDGMLYSMQSQLGSLTSRTNFVNILAIQESVINVSGNTADQETGGTVVNAIPKDGGNLFTGLGVARGMTEGMQGSNLSDALRARGISEQANTAYVYDFGVAVGGPIKTDKLWFYESFRAWGNKYYAPGAYFNKTLHTLFYTPDLSRPAYSRIPIWDVWTRLTWQVTGKQKVGFLESLEKNCRCYQGIDDGVDAPESAEHQYHWPESVTQVTWSYPRTNRLMFEAGSTTLLEWFSSFGLGRPGPDPDALDTDVEIQELFTGFIYGGRVGTGYDITNPDGTTKRAGIHQSNQRFSVSYVTGSHAAKFGMSYGIAWHSRGASANNPTVNGIPLGPVSYRFLRGVPNGLTQHARPTLKEWGLNPNLGIYAQDRWTVKNLTLNLGVRFDQNRQYAKAADFPAIPKFGIPERHFDKIDNVPNWKDISPRFGAAYDVFGDGRTALKGAYGRYGLAQGTAISDANAPTNRIAATANRSWSDADGDFFPDCDLANNLRNGECGQLSNLAFQLPRTTTTFDRDFLEGWGKRPYMWQGNLQLQQQLLPNLALNLGYYNVRYGNLPVTINSAVTPADFTSFCVTAPTDARLESFSGQPVCGLFDINPAKFGLVDEHVMHASKLGEKIRTYNGFEVGINARFANGLLVFGGYSTGQTVNDECDIVQNFPNVTSEFGYDAAGGFRSKAGIPSANTYCHSVDPFANNGQGKMAFSLPLPAGMSVAGNYQNLTGFNNNPVRRTYTNAEIQPSLGRPLSGRTSASIQIVPPFELYEDRIQQLDLRLTKTLRLGRTRIEGQFDVYNVFNANMVLNTTNTYGSTFLKPSIILSARLFKVGAQVTF